MIYRYALLLAFFFSIALTGKATHIVGGEIFYTNLGSQGAGVTKYEITLKLYRDCYNGLAPYDDPIYIFFYKANGNFYDTLKIPFPGSVQLPKYVNGFCMNPPGDVCVEEAIYKATINLPDIQGGYNLLYQRCCRNHTIVNLDSPGDQGNTYMAHIPGPEVVTKNSSPSYKQFPPIFICTNTPLYFDHSAKDLDGDSLVYSFCQPYQGGDPDCPKPAGYLTHSIQSCPTIPAAPPLPYVVYAPGFSDTYPISSNPAFSIHPKTGLLTGTPTEIGQYVLGICVSEYRKGKLLSVNKRDFQFNVLACQNAIAAIAPQTEFCTGTTITFSNNSVNATQFNWDFGVANISTDVSTLKNPTYTFPDTGTYKITLIAKNNISNCADTAILYYKVGPAYSIDFTTPSASCFPGTALQLDATGDLGPNATYRWEISPDGTALTSSNKNTGTVPFPTPGDKTIKLTVNQYGCTKSVTKIYTLHTNPDIAISNTTPPCNDLKFTFQSKNNTDSISNSYQWDFGDPNTLNDASAQKNTSYTYTQPGLYNVRVIATNAFGCKDTATITVNAFINPDPQLSSPINGQCISGNNFNFNLTGNFTNQTTFAWNFPGANTPSSNVQNPQGIQYNTVGLFPFSVTVSYLGCVQIYTDTLEVYGWPKAKFDISPKVGCAPFTVTFNDQSTFSTPPNYYWDLGDGTTSSQSNPTHTYTDSGIYQVRLAIETTTGCIDRDSASESSTVTVYPSPTAGITVDSTSVSMFEPHIHVTDISEHADSCILFFGDGYKSVNVCTQNHSYNAPGTYVIRQIVVNAYGCPDTADITVVVRPEHRFWIPNAFTPNKDGLNKEFKPVLIGVYDYRFIIYNRWGELIFDTNNPEDGWNGLYKGRECQQDVYVWKIYYKDLVLNQDHVAVGTVTLIR